MRWLINNLPNLLTCSNLACGIYAISLLSLEGPQAFQTVGYLVLLAGLFDFFDGFVARLVGATSPIGKDLDSLADMVTFGLLPSQVAFHYVRPLLEEARYPPYLAFITFIIAILSAVRLAIFNNDTRQSDRFIGVPTPANCFFIVFLVTGMAQSAFGFELGALAMLLVSVVSGLWLVMPLPLIALKFKDFTLKANWQRYVLIVSGAVGIVLFGMASIPAVILLYIGLSITDTVVSRI